MEVEFNSKMSSFFWKAIKHLSSQVPWSDVVCWQPDASMLSPSLSDTDILSNEVSISIRWRLKRKAAHFCSSICVSVSGNWRGHYGRHLHNSVHLLSRRRRCPVGD